MKIKTILLACMFPFLGMAQNSDIGNWLIYIGSKKINSKFNLHHEVQHRNYNAFGDLEQLLLRTGIGYNITENNNNILLGYGYISSQNYIGVTDLKETINEHRIFQQFITKQKIGAVKIQHRYRFEQRFVASDFKMRLRYFLATNIPLTQKGFDNNSLYLSAYNEIFINTENTFFDRNRLYGGLGYRVNQNLRLEIGYMNQRFNVGSRDQINIISFLNF